MTLLGNDVKRKELNSSSANLVASLHGFIEQYIKETEGDL